MRSSNLLKFIFISVALSASSCASCRTQIDAPPNAPVTAAETKSVVPFSTKEPENFQTEIVVTANGIEDKFFTARSGKRRLTTFDYQKASEERSILQIDANQIFLLDPRRKIYVESDASINAFGEETNAPFNFLTAELTNQKTGARFETLGAENNLTKFRVRFNDSNASEIIVWVDERIGLPVKQEFYAVNGEQKNLTLTVELKNFNLQPDAKNFELPKDFRKVTMKEFQTAF